MYGYGGWNTYCKQRGRILDQNGSFTTVQQRQRNQDDNQPTADHAIAFTRRPVLFAPGARQLILAIETGINSRPTKIRSVTSGNPVSSRANVCSLPHLTPNPSRVHYPERSPQRGNVLMATPHIMSIARASRLTPVFCPRLRHGGHPYHTVAAYP